MVRLSKYLSIVGGLTPAQVRAKLLQSSESEMQTGQDAALLMEGSLLEGGIGTEDPSDAASLGAVALGV